ncbi:hypothetical protein U1Q18_033664 [Sarracenia purpurea var. burkii]
MFHSGEGGLMSFEHPMNKLKAMPRVDSEGAMCGVNFKVDVFSRVLTASPALAAKPIGPTGTPINSHLPFLQGN